MTACCISTTGLGLGLPLAPWFLQDKGSEFWFTLPLEYHDPKQALNQRLMANDNDYFEVCVVQLLA